MSKFTKKIVSIIILNWNQKELLAKCLQSLREKTTYDTYKTLVVDNGSKDNSVKMVKNDFEWVELIENKQNLGFSKGNNIGIKYALEEHKSDFILLLNNDIELIQEGWLEKLIKVGSKKKVGIVGGKLLFPDGNIQHAGARIKPKSIDGAEHYTYDKYNTSQILEPLEYVTGACFLIKTDLIKQIGLLDEKYSPFLFEETDYCMRCRAAGYYVSYTPKAKLIHYEGASRKTSKEDSKNNLDLYSFYVRRRNLLRCILLNLPIHKFLFHLPYELKLFLRCIKKGKINEKSRKKGLRKIRCLIQAYWEIVKNLDEIMKKRLERIFKISF